jgi:hypothetical protein
MHRLSETDREALLLRFFERKPLAEIGARLGLSENAARMRIERALEKLRAELSRRGVTSTAAALTVALTERAVNAAPATLAANVSQAALAAAATGGLAAGLFKLLEPAALKWLAGVVAFGAFGWMLWTRYAPATDHSLAAPLPASSVASTNAPPQPAAPNLSATSSGASAKLDTTNKLRLHIVTADTGQPIPMVDLDFWVATNGDIRHEKTLHADRFGNCDVPVARDAVTELLLVSQRDGFADTRLQWHTDRGETIPQNYILRLARAALLGGLVVDADGNPVADAKIGFNNSVTDPEPELRTESSDFGWLFYVETTSDAQGQWQINRIAKEAVNTLEISADHPAHVGTNFSVGRDPAAAKQLLADSYVFHLGQAVEVFGKLKDQTGKPISDAMVRVGWAAFTGTRNSKTRSNGAFSVIGCKPEKAALTAVATGYAPITTMVDLTEKTGPFNLVLQPGKSVRLRAVDSNGDPAPHAYVFYNNNPDLNDHTGKPPPIQADFERRTDQDGRIEWDNAPDAELTFNISGANQSAASIVLRPDGEEHVVTLVAPASPLTLSGSVTDATTGAPLPAFQIIEGWPITNIQTGEVGAQWSTLDRFWLKFAGGTFRHTFVETPLGGSPNPGFIFKFEADGSAPFITRSFRGDEGEMKLDVALQPAPVHRLTAFLPDGQPAAKADVGLVSFGSALRFQPGDISHDHLQSAQSLLTADETGSFTLPADPAVTQIVIAHPQGFAQFAPSALADTTTIPLQPWGRVEGTLFCEGAPAPGRDVLLQFGHDDFKSIYSDYDRFKATTDDNGHFVFPQAPPGERGLALMVTMVIPLGGHARGKGWSNWPLTNLDVLPGQTVTLTVTAPEQLLNRLSRGP